MLGPPPAVGPEGYPSAAPTSGQADPAAGPASASDDPAAGTGPSIAAPGALAAAAAAEEGATGGSPSEGSPESSEEPAAPVAEQASWGGGPAPADLGAPPPAPHTQQPAPGARVGEGAVAFSHSGERYVLGWGEDFFGIWDRNVVGGPTMRLPRPDSA